MMECKMFIFTKFSLIQENNENLGSLSAYIDLCLLLTTSIIILYYSNWI